MRATTSKSTKSPQVPRQKFSQINGIMGVTCQTLKSRRENNKIFLKNVGGAGEVGGKNGGVIGKK